MPNVWEKEDLGRCDGCDDWFTDWDWSAQPDDYPIEVTHEYGSGWVHPDCLDHTMKEVK